MTAVTREQKHLTIKTSDLGTCFMRLDDVLEVHPGFVPKCVYEKMDENGRLTREHYVKCKHVRDQVDDKMWNDIKTEVVYDWFRLGRDSDVRLILCTKDTCQKK